MNGSPSPLQLREWSEQVARDPGSLAFVPLAETYRRQGRLEAASRLCVRGLQRHPNHVGAHFLLGQLYRDAGDSLRALDEWDITLRLDPEHRGARRELGLLYAERGEWDAAYRCLEEAAASDPDDEQLAAALAAVRRRREAPAAAPVAAAAPPLASVQAPEQPGEIPAIPSRASPLRQFTQERGIRGVILLDAQGLVLDGEIRAGGQDRAAEAAAALRGISDDAEHAVRHLGLGDWNSILLETAENVVHLAPVSGAVVAVAAAREVPIGWTVRLAARVRQAADQFLADGHTGRGGL